MKSPAVSLRYRRGRLLLAGRSSATVYDALKESGVLQPIDFDVIFG
jgi:hypothetical protein